MSKAKTPVERFIALPHALVNSDQWRAVSPGARCLLLEIWTRFNGKNNGEISFSQREAEAALRCSPKMAVKWFGELQNNSLIVATRRGSFNQKAGPKANPATTWRIPQAKETKKK